jgi:hypothetical protein
MKLYNNTTLEDIFWIITSIGNSYMLELELPRGKKITIIIISTVVYGDGSSKQVP